MLEEACGLPCAMYTFLLFQGPRALGTCGQSLDTRVATRCNQGVRRAMCNEARVSKVNLLVSGTVQRILPTDGFLDFPAWTKHDVVRKLLFH